MVWTNCDVGTLPARCDQRSAVGTEGSAAIGRAEKVDATAGTEVAHDQIHVAVARAWEIVDGVPLLVLALLAKFGSLAGNIASAIGALVLVIGLYFIVRKFIDINSRNNMEFDEYDWQFDPAALKPTVIEYDLAQLRGVMPTADVSVGGCFGQACCANGTVYDDTLSKCVIPSATSAASSSVPASPVTATSSVSSPSTSVATGASPV